MSLFGKLRRLFGGANGAPEAAASDGAAPDVEMISCHDALVLVHDYLDGELVDVSEAQVKAHFDVCERCYPQLHLETVFRGAVRRAASGGSAPRELKDKVARLLAEAEAGQDG